jgi:hypothetical protein
MRRWASTMQNVQFLEVCVESEAVALDFHRNYGFGENPLVGEGQQEHEQQRPPVVVNGWIPSRHYMPRGYGQLGCSGFIISDAKGNFVSRKTASFLQFGPQAFQHVESILADLLEEMEDERRQQGGAPVASTIDRGPPSPSKANAPKKVSDAIDFNGFIPVAVVVIGDPLFCAKPFSHVLSCNFVPPDDTFMRAQQKTTDSDSSSDSASGKTSPTTVASMEAPSSVGVVAMDDEHQICTDSFNRALKDPTFETLQEVFELLRSHFAHEEELIARYAIPPDQLNSPFSPLVTHQKDHFRILRIAASELQRVLMMHRSACASSCDSGGGS